MTETQQTQPTLTNSTATPNLTINCQDAEIHLAILGNRENYFVFSKNCALYDKNSKDPNAKKNLVLQKNEIIQAAEQLNRQGCTFWISLNPKTADANINVTHLSCFYMEIDARPKGVKDRLATQQELSIAKEKALTLKAYFEKQFGAISFIAYSGNGYHLLYPLPITELTPELTKQLSETDTVTNAKIRTFTQRAAAGYGIDTVCDINRKTTLIGSYNLKLASQPIQTAWLKDHIPETHEGALLQVYYARRQNKLLLDTILATSIEQQQQPTPTNNTLHTHAKLEEILASDTQLNNLYNGNFDKQRYPSRSEAEAAVLTILLGRYGFSTDEAREAMENCKIGKWRESEPYRKHTLQKAIRWVKQHPAREYQKTNAETAEDDKRKSQADRLYKIFLTQNIELFHDQNKTDYARIPITNNDTNAINDTFNIHSVVNEIIGEKKESAVLVYKSTVNAVNAVSAFETVRLKDDKFKTYLARLLYETEEKVLNHESASQVITLLKYDASHGKCYDLYNRVAPDPNSNGFWLDMADSQNRAYHITKDGWTLEVNVPILFKRYEHQRPLIVASKEGNAKKLLEYVKISPDKKADDKKSKTAKHRELLLLVQTASYLIPDIAHPVNAMFGCPGSHKSTAQRFIREIFDPSAAPLLGIPRDENAALQVLDHHYIPIFDNLDYLPRWFSDMICKAVTGAGVESRALYTDDDSVIRAFRRCVMLNGLNLPATKGDLLNRTIMHPTEPNVERRTEAELNQKYNNDLPEILGGFLDLAVKALAKKDTLKNIKFFRLADFSEWGAALANAIGESYVDFVEAMEENLSSQNEADIENNVVADAFLAEFNKETLEYCNALEGKEIKETPDTIYRLISERAANMGINTHGKKWPQSASIFTRKLNDSKNAIIACGWNYETQHDGKKRLMVIWRTEKGKLPDDGRPKYVYEKIKPAEMCGYCGNNAVEYSVKTPIKETQRRCEGCFNSLKKDFQQGANFVPLEA